MKGMTSLSVAVSAALLHFVWQATLVGSVLWVTLFVLRRRSAGFRYVLCCAALALLALLPLITVCVLYEPAPLLAVPRIVVTNVELFNDVASSDTWHPAFSIGDIVHLEQQWALTIWAFGVSLFSLRLFWSCAQTAWLKVSVRPSASIPKALSGDEVGSWTQSNQDKRNGGIAAVLKQIRWWPTTRQAD